MVGMERDACASFGKGGLGPFRGGMMALYVQRQKDPRGAFMGPQV